MKSNLQTRIQAKYDMLGIDPSIPEGEIPKGLPAPNWIHEGPVYEIFVRCFSREGNFAAVVKKLGYLRDLGIKTIWLMPIHPIGREKRKGRYGSPYAITDHMAINPDYGTKQDFKDLVDMVHDHDMRIIMDIVLNHAAPDHVEYFMTPDMFNKDLQHSPDEWSDVIEFNFQNSKTVDYAMHSMIYWVKEFGIDGYRCDVAGLVPIIFWNQVTNELLKIKPDLFMLAEWENRELHFNAFHATYDWTNYLIMKEVFQNQRASSDLLAWNLQADKTYPANALAFRFTENHDLPRTVNIFENNSYLPYLAYVFFASGIPLIYNGQEMGASIELSLFEKNIINWNSINTKIFDDYKKLIKIRNTHRSLFLERIQYILNDRSQFVVSFIRSKKNTSLIFCLNFSEHEQEIYFEEADEFVGKSLTDLLTGRKIKLGNNHINLSGSEVLILKY